MSQPHDPHDPQADITNDHITDDDIINDEDRRIDALARSAGGELRRPAPPDGILRARRTRRNTQAVRGAIAGVAAIAVIGVGFIALRNRDEGSSVVREGPTSSADSPSPTTTSTPSSTPPTTPSSASSSDPGTSVPDTTSPTSASADPTTPDTAPAPPGAGEVPVVYTRGGDITDPTGDENLVDAATGAVTGSDTIDPDRSRAAQDALPGRPRSNVDLGDVAYAFDQVVYEAGTLDTDFYTAVDLCGQNVVTVRSDAGSSLPARAHVLSVSPDDQYVVTLSSTCPEAGTMGADGIGTQIPFDATFQVFDAAHPDQPGRTLLTGAPALNVGSATYSANGRFVALELYAGDQRYFVFDLETGDQIDFGTGCTASGTNMSRFIGPWIGASSIAVVLDCADGQHLVVRDLLPGGVTMDVPAPATESGLAIRAEVDYAHFDGPTSTWFIFCDLSQRTCWTGGGNSPLVELTDVSDASFLPLGFTYGN